MSHAWAPSTAETYGTGLLVWTVFCDMRVIPEELRAPAPPDLLEAFVAVIAGAYSGSAITNFVSGIRAWHILHDLPWLANQMRLEALLKAAETLTPATSRQKKRSPCTIEFLEAIYSRLDFTKHLHVSVWGCVNTIFYCAARTGEFTVRTLTSFDPATHVKPSDVSITVDGAGLGQTNFFLPRTKSAINGENVFSSPQRGVTDPKAALEQHMVFNNPPQNGPLFAYLERGKSKPLTKAKFLQVINTAAKAASHDPLQGHGIRIGATLLYLLRGVPFDVMKVKGRWASNAFELYLTKHAQILAPYMQADPPVLAGLIHRTMPPVR